MPADLVPIARVSNTILAVGVPQSMNIATLAEFVARARVEPGKLNAAVVPGITEFTFDYFLCISRALNLQKCRTVHCAGGDRYRELAASRSRSPAMRFLQPQAQACSDQDARRVPDTARPNPARCAHRKRRPGSPRWRWRGSWACSGSSGPPLNRGSNRADLAAVTKDPAFGRLSGSADRCPGGAAEFAAAVEGPQPAPDRQHRTALGIRSKQ